MGRSFRRPSRRAAPRRKDWLGRSAAMPARRASPRAPALRRPLSSGSISVSMCWEGYRGLAPRGSGASGIPLSSKCQRIANSCVEAYSALVKAGKCSEGNAAARASQRCFATGMPMVAGDPRVVKRISGGYAASRSTPSACIPRTFGPRRALRSTASVRAASRSEAGSDRTRSVPARSAHEAAARRARTACS